MTIAALRTLCTQIPWCEPAVLESALELALEIAREGREGRRIGTLFTIGKADAVLAASRALILDPLAGHAPAHAAQRRRRGDRRSATPRSGHVFAERTG
jgi:DNA integrity scanning protein DisA with diadenylate cyclase activity